MLRLRLPGRKKGQMRVTRIEEMSRSRCKVYLDDSFAFVLYKGELRLYGIREEEEVSEQDYRQIMDGVLPRRASLRCMNLLKSRGYTESQLRRKLEEGFYPKESIDGAIQYVKSCRYVDDARFARDYIINQQERKSRRVIEMDLAAKGVARELIEEAFCETEEQGEGPDEEKLALKWLSRRHFDPETADLSEKRKMAAFLYRKGIGSETVRRAVDGRISE